ncbi:MAG: excinuclease ABC subunit C [Flavobacteriia bacterium]|nr:excinuclease ABC subunit C [Flavobacteriia bacterium]
MLSTELENKIKNLPTTSGVYQFISNQKKIIYVGKAKNLKKRVLSYFNRPADNFKTKLLVSQIADIQFLVVENEADAFLLENNLIKTHQPKYNILLKDDKSYPWICVKNEAFPRVFSTRQIEEDGSFYFGPYPSGKMMQTLLKLFNELFTIRTCSLDLSQNKIKQNKYKVCLDYHLKKCKGPCVGLQTEKEYLQEIDQMKHILKGNLKPVLNYLNEKMMKQSQLLLFEEAQSTKQKISSLENYHAKSLIVSPQEKELDTITCIQEEKKAYLNYCIVKNGALINSLNIVVNKKLEENNSEIISFVLPRLRQQFGSTSKIVLVEESPEVKEESFQYVVPQIGDKKKLLEFSIKNVKWFKLDKEKAEKIKNPEQHYERILNQIKNDLRMSQLPIHIECFDNSNIQGTSPVSACVVFKNAKPSKKDYRHFHVKYVIGPDDFATMEEVVYRRYKRLIEEKKPLPQLIVIDGGKGQLSAACKSLKKLNLLEKITIIGIAKRLEEIFFPEDSIPIYLDKRSETLKTIQFLRNEAHRFGITFHRQTRIKKGIHSFLDDIIGIGPKTKQILMEKFKSKKNILHADKNEVIQLIGLEKYKKLIHFLENH